MILLGLIGVCWMVVVWWGRDMGGGEIGEGRFELDWDEIWLLLWFWDDEWRGLMDGELLLWVLKGGKGGVFVVMGEMMLVSFLLEFVFGEIGDGIEFGRELEFVLLVVGDIGSMFLDDGVCWGGGKLYVVFFGGGFCLFLGGE